MINGTSTDEGKRQAGTYAGSLVQEDMIVGIGTGSTAYWFIKALGQRVREGLKCTGVPTSSQSYELAAKEGIALVELNDVSGIDLTIDGADEISPELFLIKGGGGALLQEKMVASASGRVHIIADHSKEVPVLGKFPLPVEVVPYGWKLVQRKIRQLNLIEAKLRFKGDKPWITDHGHYILDCHFEQIFDPQTLNRELHNIPGVVETGLFLHMATSAIIGMPDGSVAVRNPG
jgi:ribose 5-phosphate isomerase A